MPAVWKKGTEPHLGYWDGSFPYHVPSSYKTIEWLEINTVVGVYKDGFNIGRYLTGETYDYSERLSEAVIAKSIPFYQSKGIIRLQGYTRFNKPALNLNS